jgi:hypothetical protein
MFVVTDNLRDLWHIGRTRQEIFPVQQLTGACISVTLSTQRSLQKKLNPV